MLIDTHCHIYLEEFAEDREKMILRAENEGVSYLLLPAIEQATFSAMRAVQLQFPERCFAMMGLHPCSVKENMEGELAFVEQKLKEEKFVAVGEIGLDFYWDKTYVKQQFTAFNRQIVWALQYDLPIVIHSRSSLDECIAVVTEHQRGSLRGVFHCFSGTELQARQIIDLGFYVGIGGVATYKNSGLDKILTGIDLKHIVLETDAPYLTPVPFRGKRNEPAYLKYVVEKLETIKQVSGFEIAECTTKNAKKLFRL